VGAVLAAAREVGIDYDDPYFGRAPPPELNCWSAQGEPARADRRRPDENRRVVGS